VPFRFVREYDRESKRGYGTHIVIVFKTLEGDFKNLSDMSSKQFDGQGSLGNGGAMRIAPMALFCQSRNYSGKKLVVCV
jgi:poly(ADP-ribose) glycohydrolase ARH3